MILLAALGILTMPVDYRAGAALSHPHATLQLIGDLTRGSLDHHADTIDGLGHVHGDRHHKHLLPAIQANHAVPVPSSLDTNGPIQWSASRALASVLDSGLSLGAPDGMTSTDEATLSPRTGGGTYIAYKVLLPAIVVIFVRWWRQHVVWAAAASWSGVSDPPELPPPRRICNSGL